MRTALLFFIAFSFIACHKKTPAEHKVVEAESKNADTPKVSRMPLPVGVVNDFENILSISEEKELTDTIDAFKRRSGNEIVIVTVDSIKPYDDIAAYANELANTWGVGDSAKKNGMLIALSRRLRMVRIATARGTEKKVSDRSCSKVIKEKMLPEFKDGNYFTGLKNGMNALIREWEKQ
jgi:uncharacterized protein